MWKLDLTQLQSTLLFPNLTQRQLSQKLHTVPVKGGNQVIRQVSGFPELSSTAKTMAVSLKAELPHLRIAKDIHTSWIIFNY
jgi:hypothetical protein